MKTPLSLKPSTVAQFPNALHAQFHYEITQMFQNWRSDLSVINVSSELMKEWTDLIAIEVDINKEVQSSTYTNRLKAIDKQRDDLLAYLFSRIRNAKRSPLEADRRAYEMLYPIAKQYKGLSKEGVEKKTILVTGLILDLKKDYNKVHLKAIALERVTTELETRNEEFREFYQERINEWAGKLPSAKKIRKQEDAIYKMVEKLITVSHFLSTNAEDQRDIEQLVSRMNKQIEAIKVAYKLSLSNQPTDAATEKPSADPTPTPPPIDDDFGVVE